MKTRKFFIYSLGIAFTSTSILIHHAPANAMRSGPMCNYERKQAMKAGRSGNKKLTERLWLEYRACTRGKTR